jgi:DNA-damage-inducible protein J
MTHTVLNVRVDENLKKNFDEFCASVGMNASVAVNIFMRTVTRERRIPFAITDVCESAVNASPEYLSAIQKNAVREFINNVNAATTEPLDGEFDEIIQQRINLSRNIDL